MKRNPALVVWPNPRRNPLPGTKLVAEERIGDRVYEIRYRHTDDGDDYKHVFAAGVELWTVRIGQARCVVLMGKDGQNLWDDF